MTVQLKVLTLNCWGIPFVSSDRKVRMRAIASYLSSCDCDVICLQEVWSENDFELIKKSCNEKFPYTHRFRSGVVGSGICVLSTYRILETFFHLWPLNGYAHRIQHGDWWGGKGVGLCRLKIGDDWNVHIYSAHLHAEYDRERDEYLAHRVLQAYDTAQFIHLTSRGSADVVILAGDLNTEPGDLACRLLIKAARLNDSCPSFDRWVTNETSYNTYSPLNSRPKRIDYILYGGRAVCSAVYSQPLPNRVPGTNHSYSDHEAVCASIELVTRESFASNNHVSSNSEELEKIYLDSINVLSNELVTLNVKKRTYFIASIILFAALWIAGTDGSHHAIFDWLPIPYMLIRIGKIVITAVALFTLIMATMWDRIESNAIKETIQSMKLQLIQLAQR